VLIPLVECENKTIREGICAMLADVQLAAEARAAERGEFGWTAHQIAERRMLDQLRAAEGYWKEYLDNPSKRQTALRDFHKYAYDWY
jgi:hypothetical protein